jgi:tetratricopeptide (TPR) repeat protein
MLPNPNDPKDMGSLTPDNIRDQLGCISELLQTRLIRGEITNKEFHSLMQQAADGLLVGFDPERIEAAKAWQIGEIMITAKHWDQAEITLQAAVRWAKAHHNQDRLVNDTLRLARVYAEMGKVPGAIKIARTVFGVSPVDGAPILYATAYEIVPAAYDKGSDVEIAKLLEDAITIDLNVKVDSRNLPGQEFLDWRPHHVAQAWTRVVELYNHAGRADLAAEAQKKAEEAQAADRHRMASRGRLAPLQQL